MYVCVRHMCVCVCVCVCASVCVCVCVMRAYVCAHVYACAPARVRAPVFGMDVGVQANLKK